MSSSLLACAFRIAAGRMFRRPIRPCTTLFCCRSIATSMFTVFSLSTFVLLPSCKRFPLFFLIIFFTIFLFFFIFFYFFYFNFIFILFLFYFYFIFILF